MSRLREMTQEKDGEGHGRTSFSRTLPFAFAAIMTTAWLGTGAWIVWSSIWGAGLDVWAKTSGWLTWGRDFFFVSVIPYTGRQLGKIGQRSAEK